MIYVKGKNIYEIKWLFDARMPLIMSFLFLGCDVGLRRPFFGTNFLWLGWEIKAFFLGRVAFGFDIYKRVFTRDERFSLYSFFFNTRTELQGGKCRQHDDSFLIYFFTVL